MGTTNLTLVQEKLKQLNKQSNTSNSTFKIKPGTHVIRIVPNQESPDWPFVEMYMYYNIGGFRSLVSPSSYGEYDPIKAFVGELYKTGEKEDWFKARELEPKLRTYLPIIERGKEHEGVKWWGFGKTTLKDILNLMNDEDYGDITDPVKGIDLTLVVEGPNENAGRKYPTTSITPKRKSTPITEDASLLDKILNEQVSISELFPASPEADLMQVLTNIQNEASFNTDDDKGSSDVKDTSWLEDDDEDDSNPQVKEKLASFANLVEQSKKSKK